jgi:hypothetical protein
VGTLVAKILTSSTSNPYQAGQAARTATPTALDAFSVQVPYVYHIAALFALGTVVSGAYVLAGCAARQEVYSSVQ